MAIVEGGIDLTSDLEKPYPTYVSHVSGTTTWYGRGFDASVRQSWTLIS